MTWLEELINAFEAIPEDEVNYKTLYGHILNNTERKLTPKWVYTVQRTIQQHSSHSRSYNSKKGQDIFESVYGVRHGTWRLRGKVVPTPVAPDSKEEARHEKTERTKVEVYRIIRDTQKTKTLKALHLNTCQICNQTINFGGFYYSEAHHIKPLGNPHNGPDSLDNIIVLCPNHHAEFDYGLIAIINANQILHKDIKNAFHGKKLRTIKEHVINGDFLEYHLTEIFDKRKI